MKTAFLPIAKAEMSVQDADAFRLAVLRIMAGGDPRAEVAAILYHIADIVEAALPADHPTHTEMRALRDFVDGATEWRQK